MEDISNDRIYKCFNIAILQCSCSRRKWKLETSNYLNFYLNLPRATDNLYTTVVFRRTHFTELFLNKLRKPTMNDATAVVINKNKELTTETPVFPGRSVFSLAYHTCLLPRECSSSFYNSFQPPANWSILGANSLLITLSTALVWVVEQRVMAIP